MANSLGHLSPAAVTTGRFSSSSRPPSPPVVLDLPPINRRSMALGLSGAVWSWSAKEEANAAARRPPPPPQAEKKDPNVSGVQAKVLASKKRKEAMKAAIAKLRERGNSINEPSPPPPSDE
ncbi:PREDICTED: uncharacterized protein LOC104813690 [Tarenaya hassleriana]|uniref:uncharacterized protein LOC104813690 n=1 Tax=Tarenaya hassleriana TaxID=28532 RepID=UPI00053C80D9|nr:PREDICTED: uncharacterized protein LOC104813690 [Tarenaya hassleriana]